MSNPPTCFISYSYDSDKHASWVKRFARKLKQKHVDVRLDSLDNLLGDDLVEYMVNAVNSADRVILICTPKYCEKVEGGAAFEKMLVGAQLAKSALTKKFIPVLKSGDKESSIPAFLHTKLHISMSGTRIKTADIDSIARSIRKGTRPTKTSKAKTKKRPISRPRRQDRTEDISDVSRIRPVGYTLLGGRGADGIRYVWKAHDNLYTESVAFNIRLRAFEISELDRKISAYTTSVSFGCQLQTMGLACAFCATGCIKYRGDLTAEEIALQNIFMAEYDRDCPSWPEVRENGREFAFMGQGEPGLCYPQVRRAILLTDIAMDQIGQKVHRYILASAGIPEMVDLLIADMSNKTFNSRVTLHFSLHAVGNERTALMPVDRIHPYARFLAKTRELYDVTKEKVAIGILLFENFMAKHGAPNTFTITIEYLDRVLNELDPECHRIDLCDINPNRSIEQQREVSNEKARELLALVHNRGFDAKLFSSFGANKNSGCGMLKSARAKVQDAGRVTLDHFGASVDLLRGILKNE